MSDKQKAIQYLESDRSFGAGIQLYKSLPGHNRAVVASLSRKSDSASVRSQLHYDICKSVGITERQMRAILAKPVAAKAVAHVKKASKKAEAKGKDLNNLVVEIPTDYKELKAIVKKLGLDVADQKKATLTAALQAHIDSKKK